MRACTRGTVAANLIPGLTYARDFFFFRQPSPPPPTGLYFIEYQFFNFAKLSRSHCIHRYRHEINTYYYAGEKNNVRIWHGANEMCS